MASSDNVLRGGLTPKHVDVPELLHVLRFDTPRVAPASTRQQSALELVYETPAQEFELSRMDLDGSQQLGTQVSGPELWLCVEGQAGLQLLGCSRGRGGTAEPGNTAVPHVRHLRRGEACFLPASVGAVRVSGKARLFRAAVGGSAAAAETAPAVPFMQRQRPT